LNALDGKTFIKFHADANHFHWCESLRPKELWHKWR
jgi:hypothetical protein